MRKFHTTLVVSIDGLEPEWTMTQEMDCLDRQKPQRMAQSAARAIEENVDGLEVNEIGVSETVYK